jgi:hypothetical protein
MAWKQIPSKLQDCVAAKMPSMLHHLCACNDSQDLNKEQLYKNKMIQYIYHNKFSAFH